MSFLARVVRVVKRGVELFPLTPLGIGVAAGGALAFYYYGVKKVDLVLFALAGIAVVVAAVALLTTVITSIVLAVRLRRWRAQAGLRLECGTPTTTELALPSFWFIPLVSVSWTWLEPLARVVAASKKGRLHETVIAERRGSYDRVKRRLEVSDAFRLTKVTLLHDEECSAYCLPSVGALKKMNVIRSLSSGDSFPNPTSAAEGDRSDLRNYSPGDPVRFILWRVFAKTRQLVIRVPERAQSVATKAVAYLVAGPGDEAAAGAARMTLESGALGTGWVFGADGCGTDARSLDAAHGHLAATARIAPSASGAGLAGFLDRHPNAGRVLVFVPAEKGEWLARVTHAVLRRGAGSAAPANVEIVVCCDGIDRASEPAWLRRVTVATKAETGQSVVSLDASTEVLRALASTRARVLLLDRKTGRIHDAGEQLRLVAGAKPLTAAAAPQGTAQGAGQGKGAVA
ncbi:MAG: DUF58 domain-containing protein [Deltaproteobacteria bacterium]|nr:DUF58 domain-containing protein [Deltaproteobacteria bacterium]